jgi:hypothetical protein
MKRILLLALAVAAAAYAGVTTRPPSTAEGGSAGSGGADNVAPAANITSPATGGIPQPVTVHCTFTDPPPSSGPGHATFYYLYCPGGVCGSPVLIGSSSTVVAGPAFEISWMQPGCGPAPQDNFTIQCYVFDVAGNQSAMTFVNVRAVGRGC